jgi:hypothetical protein
MDDRDFIELVISTEVDECRTFTEVFWKMSALRKKRVWFCQTRWSIPRTGTDEYWRRTIVIGPLVIALWTTKQGKMLYKKLEEKFNYMLHDNLV